MLAKWMTLRADEDRLLSYANVGNAGCQVPLSRIERDIARLERWSARRAREAQNGGSDSPAAARPAPPEALGGQLLDPALSGREPLPAGGQVALALLEERHGLLEPHLAALEPRDDLVQAAQGLLEGHGRLARPLRRHDGLPVAVALTRPSRSSSSSSRPGSTPAASATTAPPPASRTIA